MVLISKIKALSQICRKDFGGNLKRGKFERFWFKFAPFLYVLKNCVSLQVQQAEGYSTSVECKNGQSLAILAQKDLFLNMAEAT